METPILINKPMTMTINHEQYIFTKVRTLVAFFEEPSEDKI